MESALEDIPGVNSANADYLTGRANVIYDPDQTTPESIVVEFNSQGFYSASVESTVDGEPPMQMAEREDGAAEFMTSGHMFRNMNCRSPMSGFWWNLW
ncbi:MAG: cation transporter [SAR324 cluster bacterium]|nr:cation transporter [SAR324 cluster bacterium]